MKKNKNMIIAIIAFTIVSTTGVIAYADTNVGYKDNMSSTFYDKNTLDDNSGHSIGTQNDIINTENDMNSTTSNSENNVSDDSTNSSDNNLNTNNDSNNYNPNVNTESNNNSPQNEKNTVNNNQNFETFRGRVQKIDNGNSEDERYVTVTNQFGQNVKFFVTDKTYYTDTSNFEFNNDVVVVYDSNSTNKSYDTEFNAMAITNDIVDSNVKVSSFDDEYISSDNQVRLSIDNKTNIVSSDGEMYSGDFEDKKLLVFYDDSQDSNSSDVTPRRIVVYNDKISKSLDELNKDGVSVNQDNFTSTLSEEDSRKLKYSKAISDLIVNLNPVTIEHPFQTENAVTMVPLDDVARVLDIEVNRNEDSQMVGIDNNFFILLGHSGVTVDGKTHLLDAAPVIYRDKVYVSVDFFSKALDKIAFEKDGKVIINDSK